MNFSLYRVVLANIKEDTELSKQVYGDSLSAYKQ